ncbi:MAG: SelT/SelW/SelH family protein [Verrucomicrobiota bacterium JB022]|nr:SelT/SelW/SelH family protein [Verrucomicrobiota bacterium JB022]
MSTPARPVVEIHFCPGCRWWLRAGYTAQELFATFGGELAEVRIISAEQGTYVIKLDGQTIWDRRVDNGFPEIADLKRRIRDLTAPDRELGHLDRSKAEA